MKKDLTYIILCRRKKPALEDGTPDIESRTVLGLPAHVYGISSVKDGVGYAPFYEVVAGSDGVEHRKLERGTHAYNKLEKLVGKVKPNYQPGGARCKTVQRRLLSNSNPGCLLDASEVEEVVLTSALYTAMQRMDPAEIKELFEEFQKDCETVGTYRQSHPQQRLGA